MSGISKEYLEKLNLEELKVLYTKYFNMGKNIIKFDVNQGLAVLDMADSIEYEINRRNENNTIKVDSDMTRLKKIN